MDQANQLQVPVPRNILNIFLNRLDLHTSTALQCSVTQLNRELLFSSPHLQHTVSPVEELQTDASALSIVFHPHVWCIRDFAPFLFAVKSLDVSGSCCCLAASYTTVIFLRGVRVASTSTPLDHLIFNLYR